MKKVKLKKIKETNQSIKYKQIEPFIDIPKGEKFPLTCSMGQSPIKKCSNTIVILDKTFHIFTP